MTSNPTAGASPSPFTPLPCPRVETAAITSVIQHELRATDLPKLDSRFQDKNDRQVLAFNGTGLEISSNDSVATEWFLSYLSMKWYPNVALQLVTCR